MQLKSFIVAGLLGLSASSLALAGPGASYTFTTIPSINTGSATNWSGAANAKDLNAAFLNGSGAPGTGPWVSVRITANVSSGGTALQSSFGLGSAAATGTSLTPNFGTGNTAYYSASGQAYATPNNFTPYWFNSPLATTYAGGNPLLLSVRNSGGTSTFTNVSVTLFQAAVADISDSLLAGDPTYLRPNSFSGTGSPTAGSNQQTYRAYAFTVSATGTYLASLIDNASSGMYGLLYQNSFDPANPTANLLRSNNSIFGSSIVPSVGGVVRGTFTSSGADFQTSGVPGLTLNAGTTYYFVAAGNTFGTATTGDFKAFFEGPGSVTVLPVPGSAGLLVAGGLVALRRRRA